jgi:hypothetical protein
MLVNSVVFKGVSSLIFNRQIKNERTSSVETIGKKEIGEKVQKRLWKRPNFSNGQPDLLEPNGGVA